MGQFIECFDVMCEQYWVFVFVGDEFDEQFVQIEIGQQFFFVQWQYVVYLFGMGQCVYIIVFVLGE